MNNLLRAHTLLADIAEHSEDPRLAEAMDLIAPCALALSDIVSVVYPDSLLCSECAEGGCDYVDCGCSCHFAVDGARERVGEWLHAMGVI